MKEVREGWRDFKIGGTHGFILSAKLKFTRKVIKRCVLAKKNVQSLVVVCEKRLRDLDSRVACEGWSKSLRAERVSTLSKLWKGYRKVEQMWRQKSRVKWLKEGDRNSMFFHVLANGRRRSNHNGEIFVDGNRITNPSLFADDMILFLKPNLDYLCNARRVLRCFNLAAGLRINFHKSCVIRVGRNGNREDLWAVAFKCGDSLHLKSVCLRIYAVAVKKKGGDSRLWKLARVTMGIRGVLRDGSGNVHGLFSEFVGVSDSITTELLAIHKAVSLCSSSSFFHDKEVIFISDSKADVS
ncbi:hypothetical protein Dsin_030103 [Dipteronia sinensis]|uniref:RNase H type-1 domain-containing protein n=1 Tax=Dipteronia sinensis TaxID=43782 RepID=A0AAD9ZIE9_9ROSI|nr:hypothetical protein Dsin_030103 [Dipteronia sinensis]